MDIQEAIRLIRNLPTRCEFTDAYGEPIDSDAYYEAVDMAISALHEQEEKHSNESSLTQKVLDTISRQAAIDATWEEPSYTDPINVLTEVRDKIKRLPSAQPNLQPTCNQLATDCISRQAAIDAAESAFVRGVFPTVYIRELPSAQPEIVRCKDCEYCVPGYITDNDDFIPPRCGRLRQTMRISGDDYCSFGERRTDEGD